MAKDIKNIGHYTTVWHNNYHQTQGVVTQVHIDGQLTLDINELTTGKPVKGFPV